MAPPRVHKEHGKFLINTYRLEVLNKNSGERSRVTWPSFKCLSILDMISQNMMIVISI